MSTFEPTHGGNVLRQETSRLGSRRLPLSQSVEKQPSAVAAPEQPDLAKLRIAFADELAALGQEVRSRALAEAGQIAEQELATAREKLQVELREEQEKQLKAQRQIYEQKQRQLTTLIQELEAQRNGMTEAMAPVIGRLAMSMVLRLLGQHIADHVLVADLATHAIEHYRLDNPLRIRVSEADYRNLLDASEDQTLKELLQIDHEATAGSCVIDFGAGQLDASLDTQLDALKAALLNKKGGERVAKL